MFITVSRLYYSTDHHEIVHILYMVRGMEKNIGHVIPNKCADRELGAQNKIDKLDN